MTTITVSNASPHFQEANSEAASENSAAKATAGDTAVSELASERAANIAPHGADFILTAPSAAAHVPQEFARIIASILEDSHQAAHINPMMNEATTTAARMLMENPALEPLEPLEMLDQIDPMLAQSVAAAIGSRVAPGPAAATNKRDEDVAPGVGDTDGVPAASAPRDRYKALIAILMLANLLRDSAKEEQATQLRMNVASTKISADQLVSAAKANVGGAVAGLTLTVGLAGVGTAKVLSGNKATRASISDNLERSNARTASAHAIKERSLKAADKVNAMDAQSVATTGQVQSDATKKAAGVHAQSADVEYSQEMSEAAKHAADHARALTLAQDTTAAGHGIMQGTMPASTLAAQGGYYAASMNQQASTLAKSDADVAQGTADTERDSAAAHAEVSAKMLQILQAIARQEFDRNSTIVTARAA